MESWAVEALSKLPVQQLRNIAKAAGRKIRGRKGEVFDRLISTQDPTTLTSIETTLATLAKRDEDTTPTPSPLTAEQKNQPEKKDHANDLEDENEQKKQKKRTKSLGKFLVEPGVKRSRQAPDKYSPNSSCYDDDDSDWQGISCDSEGGESETVNDLIDEPRDDDDDEDATGAFSIDVDEGAADVSERVESSVAEEDEVETFANGPFVVDSDSDADRSDQ